MYEVEIRVRWRSGHRLLMYKGKCKNMHGEGYEGIFVFEGKKLNKVGILLDFGKVKRQIKEWIDKNWDHAFLLNKKDDVVSFVKEKGFKYYVLPFNPTAERLAEYLFKLLKSKNLPIKKVGVVESFNDSVGWYYE